MVRDLLLSVVVLFCLYLSFRHVYAGVLTWTWLTIMQPHQEVTGVISHTLRLNFTVAIVTLIAWYYAKGRKTPQPDVLLATTIIFFAWVTVNGFLFAYNEYTNFETWDRLWKILMLGLLVMATANTRIRIHALIWVIMLSLCYYGVKGGLLTIMTGGAKTISGPPNSYIGDNNQLALSLLMTLPLVYYLWMYTAHRWVRLGIMIVGLLSFVSVMGSYSRGAYLSLVALCVLGWFRIPKVRNKFLYPILVVAVVYPILQFMPQSFYNRLDTLNALDTDQSFQGRIQAWQVAYEVARDYFPFGAGIKGPETDTLYNVYMPGATSHAAHSIYFQILGEHGFLGLGIYVVILVLAFWNTATIRKMTRRRPELSWAYHLASMVQLSLLVFCIGGASLSHAYYDLFWIWIGLLPALRNLIAQTESGQAAVPRRRVSASPSPVPAALATAARPHAPRF